MRACILLVLSTLAYTAIGQQQKWHSYDQPLYTTETYFATNSTDLGTAANDDWREVRSHINKLGKHSRYQQLHMGIPVIGADYVLHSKDGYVMRANGKAARNIDVNTSPKLTGKAISATILQDQPQEVTITTQNLVIINKAFPRDHDSYVLAYETTIKSTTDRVHETIYTDANNGMEIYQYSHICHHQVPGTGETFYYGKIDLDIDQDDNGIYVLRDPSRGNDGIRVLNDADGRSEFTSMTPDFDLRNDDIDEIACDLLYCTATFYDVMLEKFDWAGLDGNNLSMNGIVHANDGMPFLNAFWDGQYAHFGDGDCHNNPLATMMITAHEFMHGITDYTSDLIYADESGGLNEGMSDIFGKYTQYLHDPESFDWTADSTIVRTELGLVFRDMSNPNRKANPAYYNGNFWQPGPTASVHNNSGVLNYWFYLLSEGKSGVNEVGYTYDVKAIGIDKAAMISWLCQSSYLTPSSTYQDMYDASIAVVNDLYGIGSSEMEAVLEAWTTVGVGLTDAQGFTDVSIVAVTRQVTCIQNGELFVDLVLLNTGTEVIPADEIFEVTIGNFSQDFSEIIVLDEDLQPEGFVSFTTEQAFEIEDELSSFNFIEIEVLYSDAVDQNNTTTYFNTNATKEELDLTLTGVLISEKVCSSDRVDVEIRLSNESCDAVFVSDGLILELYDVNDDLVKTVEMVTSDPADDIIVFPARSVFPTVSTNLSTISEIERAVLIYAGDSFEGNNTTAAINYEFLVTNDDGLIDEDFENRFGRPSAWTGSAFEVGEFDGSKMLITSSQWTFNQDFLNLCDDLLQVLENPIFEQSITETKSCVDASTLSNVVLSFDLIQFRDASTAALPEYEDLTVFTAVTWGEGDNEETELIYGQEEGVRVSNTVSLPDNYVGPLSIKLFSKVGAFAWPPVAADCQMIDNILLTGVVSTDEASYETITSISPNPTTGLIYLDTDHTDNLTYTVHAVDGSAVQAGTIQRGSIDLSDLQAGIYMVRLTTSDGQQQTSKVIKM